VFAQLLIEKHNKSIFKEIPTQNGDITEEYKWIFIVRSQLDYPRIPYLNNSIAIILFRFSPSCY